jgi:hypothetical protein
VRSGEHNEVSGLIEISLVGGCHSDHDESTLTADGAPGGLWWSIGAHRIAARIVDLHGHAGPRRGSRS